MSRGGLVDFGKVSFGYAHFLGYLLREKEVVEELTKKLLQENAFSADEPDGFQAKYDAYVERHKKLEARCGELLSQQINP